MAVLKEADITRQIRDVLDLKGIFHWKQWQGPMSQPKGVSDILGCYEGKLLAIEVKVPGKHPSREQIAFIHAVQDAGGIAFVAYSPEDVIQRLGLKGVRLS
jgi:hypothetical protein